MTWTDPPPAFALVRWPGGRPRIRYPAGGDHKAGSAGYDAPSHDPLRDQAQAGVNAQGDTAVWLALFAVAVLGGARDRERHQAVGAVMSADLD